MQSMVITILEARVAPEKQGVLEQEYRQRIGQLEAGIVQTFLLRDARDSARWQIATVWRSREALDEMRNSGETPTGVLIFRQAGAEPTLSVLNVVAHAAETV
jgi:heme-degrading monooxygenase HmoA